MFHRQAYTPRVWPTFIISVGVATLGAVLFSPGPFLAFGVGVAAGILPVRIRWAVWKHRHPVLSDDELYEVIQETAYLN